MKIGLSGRFGDSPDRDIAYLKDFAVTAESLGFDSLWMPEHVVFFSSYESKYPYHPNGTPPFGSEMGIYDPLFLATVASQVTTTLRFATSVMVLPQRPALLTAKEVMTVDHITGGRFMFGVGAGWSAEEYRALGVPFEKRGQRFNEYIDAIRAAWTQDRASFQGEYVSFEDVVLLPKPVTPGGPPLLIGGDSKAAMRRAARQGDGWYGWWATYELEPHLETFRTILEEEGRASDPNFKLIMGRPVRDESPDLLPARLELAREQGVEEFVMAVPIEVATMEKDLRFWADLAGLSAH